ncbi:hypothetical protein Hanom_Chr17g01590621 [Helianthus anomalus]
MVVTRYLTLCTLDVVVFCFWEGLCVGVFPVLLPVTRGSSVFVSLPGTISLFMSLSVHSWVAAYLQVFYCFFACFLCSLFANVLKCFHALVL